jgi:hypothetical protein
MEMPQQEEWIFVPAVYGHMYATNHGIPMMLELPAENWAYQVPFQKPLLAQSTVREMGQH